MIHYITSNGLGNAWVGNELRILLREGIPFKLHSLIKPPSTFFESEDMKRVGEETRHIYPLRKRRFAKAVALAPLRYRQRFLSALWNAATGPRESLVIRAKSFWHLMVACDWAASVADEEVTLIHSQWIHSGGTVAMYGAWLLGVPYSFTGHAADLFRDRAALKDKIERAAFIVCISKFHEDFYKSEGARADQLRLAYCGIDCSHFSPSEEVGKHRPLSILSSGRLVDKKGFSVLIKACALLKDRGMDFRCTIAGSGPLESRLRSEVNAAGMQDHISLTGEALLQEKIPEFMSQGDIYCLPCVWAPDNDVDGLPQMLMEAMACGLPAVSTKLVGIPDLIIHEETGLLAEPEDASGLADCLQRLAEDPEFAKKLASQGRQRVETVFDISTSLTGLVNEFKRYLGMETA